MIGKLRGTIDSISGNTIVLDVNGVGYVVSAGARTLSAIGGSGDACTLLIETIVREDAITLYGFADASERHWFKTLTTVQGVGPRVCLSILSACTPDQLALAIGAKDHVPLTRADGVGPKLAQRIVMELKDKNLHSVAIPAGASPEVKQKRSKQPANDTSHAEDAVSALINLGYGRSEAYTAVNTVMARGDNTLANIISMSLKELAA